MHKAIGKSYGFYRLDRTRRQKLGDSMIRPLAVIYDN
jgi:hypothetical protein